MRVFSKFHDYYDGCLAYGADPKTVYLRNEIPFKSRKEWPIHIHTTPLRTRFRNVISKFLGRWGEYDHGLILFCGKPYPYVCFSRTIKGNQYNPTAVIELTYCYNIEQIGEYFAKHGSKEERIQYFNSVVRKQDSFKQAFEVFFKQNQIVEKTINDILCKFESPCIHLVIRDNHYEGDALVVNPELKKLQFYRIVDAYTAFQELSMYISGVMGGSAPPMIEIGDKIRAEKHGFDKWSFRKKVR